MPPKKKGGKKKSSKKSSSSHATAPKTETVILPNIPSAKTTALMHTVAASQPKTLTRLVTHYNFTNEMMKTDINKSTLLHISARKGDRDTLSKLLELRAQSPGDPQQVLDLNARELSRIGGYAPIHHAVEQGNIGTYTLYLSLSLSLSLCLYIYI